MSLSCDGLDGTIPETDNRTHIALFNNTTYLIDADYKRWLKNSNDGEKGKEGGILGKEFGNEGAKYGHLGAVHGKKGGRPKKEVNQ